MTKRKVVAVTAVAATAALVMSACSSTVGSSDTTTSQQPTTAAPAQSDSGSPSASGGASGSQSTAEQPAGDIADTITIGLEQFPGGYNGNTASANTVYNAYVDNLTQSAFVTVQPDGSIKPNTEFGTYEKVSDNPLTIKYTFNDKAVWSDGTPIDFDDLLLTWAAFSGTYKTGQKDSAGNDIGLFDPASTNGWSEIEKPKGKAGDKTFTLVFKQPYVDWEVLVSGIMPAHIAAKQGGLSADNDGAELVDAIEKDDTAKLKKVADFWNKGWAYGEHLATVMGADLQPSSGPYKFDNASGGALTVVKNDKWWGTPGKTDKFVFKEVNPQEWVQALANGDIDQYDPSNPDKDTVDQLTALGDKAKFTIGDSLSFSHVDLDHTGVFKDLKVRQAFAYCVPRKDLVAKFAAPVNPKAEVLDLREFLPAQGNYQDILSQVPDAHTYDEVNLDKSKQLLTEAGVKTPLTIRFARAKTSDLRAQQVQLIKASCDKAGFNIVDQPEEDLFSTLPQSGKWDATVFGFSGSGLVASGQSIYITGGDQNYGKYSSKVVDDVWQKVITSTDRDTADKLKIPFEEQLWKDVYNLPLYATPGLAAWNSKVTGPSYNATQYGTTWNAATWTKAAS